MSIFFLEYWLDMRVVRVKDADLRMYSSAIASAVHGYLYCTYVTFESPIPALHPIHLINDHVKVSVVPLRYQRLCMIIKRECTVYRETHSFSIVCALFNLCSSPPHESTLEVAELRIGRPMVYEVDMGRMRYRLC